MRKIPFTKMSGSGNDFILIDNRRRILKEDFLKRFVKAVCKHRLSVGGDGVILIEPSRQADFRWRLFNADGGEAEFSGNGARCAARFAYLRKIGKNRLTFETLAGLVRAEIKKTEVKVQFPDVKDLRLNLKIPLDDQSWIGHFINTGVPHVVNYVNDLDIIDVVEIGKAMRHHSLFQPAGANVDFAMLMDPNTVRLRTYERGVEDETLACGTGSVAAALVTGALAKGQSPVTIISRSGKPLTVHFRWDGLSFSDVFLEGEAMTIYEGQMWEEAWQ